MSPGLLSTLTRKKTFTRGSLGKSELSRCMTLTDLTLLGVGATLGLGVYVLAGSVAKYHSGPATMLSFLVAAIASAIAGICYCEFASRVPRAGSAYIYSYVTVGELVAFIIGWNLILEYIIGGASVARGLVGYVDAQFNDSLATYMREAMPMNVAAMSPYPDFIAFLVMMLLSAVLAAGVKESTLVNNIFTVVNVLTILVVVGAGCFKADVSNWRLPAASVPADAGDGGFMPFGVAGVMSGAAQCFYGFVGFDAVATTGEEAKNPKRNIPLSIIISLSIIFLAYFAISIVLTLMWPYYDQNPTAPLPHVFTMVGWPAITWVVTLGAVFALCTAMMGAMFPLPRVLYAMANDGLIFHFLAKVNPRTKTPAVATLFSGLVAGILAMIFDLHQLVEMLSIGTLLAYTIVAICVLVLRYEDVDMEAPAVVEVHDDYIKHYMDDLFNLSQKKYPSPRSAQVSKWIIGVFCALSVMLCLLVSTGMSAILSGEPAAILSAAILILSIVITLIVLSLQPTTSLELTFMVPLVPVLPAISININIFLMMMLEPNTWVRFSIWMLIGFVIYFGYGVRHSKQRRGVATPNQETSMLKPRHDNDVEM